MPKHLLKVGEEYSEQRLDIFISKILPDIPSRSFVKKLIDNGHVKLNESVVKPHHRVSPGDDVSVDIPDTFLTPQYVAPEDIPLDIVFEDDYLFVVNKPSGMMVHPAQNKYSGTLVNALLNRSVELSSLNSDIRPGIVHRLDMDTSGLILIAKDNITHARLAKQFQRHTIKKIYVALVEGEVEFDEGKIDAPIGTHMFKKDKKAVRHDGNAKKALTFYKVIKRTKDVSLVELTLKTGRTHQLRVHMAYIKHPILGDVKYGNKHSFPRLALHSRTIGFEHPISKEYKEFTSEPPPEFFEKIGLPAQ